MAGDRKRTVKKKRIPDPKRHCSLCDRRLLIKTIKKNFNKEATRDDEPFISLRCGRRMMTGVGSEVAICRSQMSLASVGGSGNKRDIAIS